MPAALREHQHEVSSLDGTTAFLFGTEDTGYLTLTRPVIEGGDLRTNDRDRSQEDGTQPGRDWRSGKTVTFAIGVLTDADNAAIAPADPYRTNLDYLDAMETFWYDEQWRESMESWAMLRTHEAGRTVRCYGRPRKYTPVTGNATAQGYSGAVATFDMFDPNWYSDVEQAITVDLHGGYQGGLSAPLIAPITTTAESITNTFAIIGGRRRAWPVVEFHGPVTNPEVKIGDTVIGLTGTVGDGEVIVYDPQPWTRQVYRLSDGAGFPGMLSRTTPLGPRVAKKPGTYVVSYRGNDVTGSSYAVVRWREAWSRP